MEYGIEETVYPVLAFACNWLFPPPVHNMEGVAVAVTVGPDLISTLVVAVSGQPELL